MFEVRLARRRAKQARRALSVDRKNVVDRVAAETYTSSKGDIVQAEQLARMRLAEIGYDLQTIIAMIEVLILIYKLLVAFNVLAPTPEIVAALLEDDNDG